MATAISSTAAAAVSGNLSLSVAGIAHVYASSDLNVGELVTIEVTPDGGTTWIPARGVSEQGVVLSDLVRSQLLPWVTGTFRLVKTATAVATAVYIDV